MRPSSAGEPPSWSVSGDEVLRDPLRPMDSVLSRAGPTVRPSSGLEGRKMLLQVEWKAISYKRSI